MVHGNPDRWLGGKFNGKDPQKVVLKREMHSGAHGETEAAKGEITIDQEAINASPDTDDPNLNVALTVFHELWHVAKSNYRGHDESNDTPEC